MSMNQLSISPEINMGDVLHAMVEEFGTEELIDFVDELVEQIADGDFTNELYELMRAKHEDWLEEMGLEESDYRTDYADPTIYSDVEMDDEDDDDEEWSTDPDDDFFTTDDK